MRPIRFPIDYPGLYWTIAAIFSLYYGVRGVMITSHSANGEPGQALEWSPLEQWMVHRIQSFVVNAACGLAGFAALYAARRIFDGIADFSAIGGGTAVVLSFLVLVAITGTTGTLPMLVAQGKLFGWK